MSKRAVKASIPVLTEVEEAAPVAVATEEVVTEVVQTEAAPAVVVKPEVPVKHDFIQHPPISIRRAMYGLFINDEVSIVGTGKAPTGVWHMCLVDTENGKMFGPYVMMAVGPKGQRELAGFCNQDTLKTIGYSMIQSLIKDHWTGASLTKGQCFLADSEHKFMSNVFVFTETK